MKKITILILLLTACALSLHAQVTQLQADTIVLDRMSSDTRAYTLYAKQGLQEEGYTITTSQGEVFELDYPCWVYFAHYAEETTHKYLIVKENTGSLLEVNVRNDTGPEDLNWWWSVTPPPPCHCIMDTLRGEWSWRKWTTGFSSNLDNRFESVIKIFSQNADGSINYEVFVEDTLFSKGSFHFLSSFYVNIKLPHWDALNFPCHYYSIVDSDCAFYVYFRDKHFTDIGWIRNPWVFTTGGVDAAHYIYQKIR